MIADLLTSFAVDLYFVKSKLDLLIKRLSVKFASLLSDKSFLFIYYKYLKIITLLFTSILVCNLGRFIPFLSKKEELLL
jgi:hypothetical protein